MASGKEIRQQISSVKNTQKITKAMEMVAAAKMRRTQDRMRNTRPYVEHIKDMIASLSEAYPEYTHPYTEIREVKTVGIIIVSTDRGLCGGLNANVFRQVTHKVSALKAEGKAVKFCIIGGKAESFIKSVGGDVIAATTQLGDSPALEQLIGCIEIMLKAYDEGEIDQLVMVHSVFVNSMTQSPELTSLLPARIEKNSEEKPLPWDYLYEPTAEVVLSGLMTHYVESLIYQAVVENVGCEMAARMIAMKNATDNAGNMIHELNLAYNKARQAAITQELSEIISGASAV